MPSSKPPARASKLILLSMLLAAGLSACVQAPPVFLNASDCSGLVPEEWYTTGVPSTSLPSDPTVGAWVAFGDAQTAQLDTANSRTKDSHTIIAKCETLQAAAAKSLQPKPWWQFW